MSTKKAKGLSPTKWGSLQTVAPVVTKYSPNPYTQKWLATQCGMTKAKLVHFFQGNRVPSIVTLLTIAKALDSSIDDLVEGVTHSLLADLGGA